MRRRTHASRRRGAKDASGATQNVCAFKVPLPVRSPCIEVNIKWARGITIPSQVCFRTQTSYELAVPAGIIGIRCNPLKCLGHRSSFCLAFTGSSRLIAAFIRPNEGLPCRSCDRGRARRRRTHSCKRRKRGNGERRNENKNEKFCFGEFQGSRLIEKFYAPLKLAAIPLHSAHCFQHFKLPDGCPANSARAVFIPKESSKRRDDFSRHLVF